MTAALPLLALALLGLQSGAPDSTAVLRRAREAQTAFERARRAHLPLTFHSHGRAEERIGRFRFWHDAGGPKPPPEPPRIAQARERLLAVLDSSATSLPGDPWIAGQLVRYLSEHGRIEDAVRAARRCAAAPWWCRALEGLARHVAGDFAAAERAFDAALAGMPDELRCRWTDVSPLLEGAFRERYRRLDCARRAPLDARVWWLARPLHLLPGNDRRTEHLARRTMAEIQRGARNAYGMRWGPDMEEIMVRYGWPVAWGAEAPRSGAFEQPGVVGYDRTPSFRFVPAPGALAEPYASRDHHWGLRPPAPRASYGPAYADSFVALPHQASVFRRGDSTLVLAAYDLTQDAGFGGAPVEVALFVSPDPLGKPAIARSTRSSDVLVVQGGPGAVLVAIEALSLNRRRAARVRYAVPPPPATRVAVSDLLLLEPRDRLPAALDQALIDALPSAELGARRRIVVFWETYGVDAGGEPIDVALSVRRVGEGALWRAARALGLAGPANAVRLEWRESPRVGGGGPVRARALLLDLSTLGPGRYRIELSVDVEEQDPLVVAREVALADPPPRQ